MHTGKRDKSMNSSSYNTGLLRQSVNIGQDSHRQGNTKESTNDILASKLNSNPIQNSSAVQSHRA